MKRDVKKQRADKQKLGIVFGAAVVFRIGMYLIAALIMAFRIGEGGTFTFADFLNGWCKWDSPHYLDLAQKGYVNAVEVCATCRTALLEKGVSDTVMQNGQHLFLVFYPLYPLLIRILSLGFGSAELAALVVSTLAYAGGCVYIYRLIYLDYSEQIAINTIILMSLFPFSFFFGGIMTEGLFLLVSAATLYYIRVHKWWWAILFGIFATMTRTQGILLGIPAGIEWLLYYRPITLLKTKDFKCFREFVLRGFSLFLMLIGYGVYLFINWKVEGYAFSYMVYQKSHWNNEVTFPTNCLKYVWTYAFSPDRYSLQMRLAMWIPEALIFGLSVILFIYGIKKLRALHMAYGIVYTVVTYSSTWLISGGRYTICCVPLFLAMALLAEKKKWIMTVTAYVFSILQIIYMTGYFNYLHIM